MGYNKRQLRQENVLFLKYHSKLKSSGKRKKKHIIQEIENKETKEQA